MRPEYLRKLLARARSLIAFVSVVTAPLSAIGAESALTRVSNNSLVFTQKPQLFNYHTVETFPGLSFDRPVRITTPPGETDRVFVVEQAGLIKVINLRNGPTASTFLDLSERTIMDGESGLLNVAFHPNFASNGSFFVFYTLNDTTEQGNGLHDRLARFQVSPDDPNRANPKSEIVLINQYDRHPWHNAGALAFGPDGYLYLTVGDEGEGEDQFNNSQQIDRNFFSGILRLDVDKHPDNPLPNPHPAVVGNYHIPADNPFVNATSFNGRSVNPTDVRTEFYATGLRNAWRFSFDPKTGVLICSDTGEFTREEVNVIKKGGNYGWAYREGSLPGIKWKQAPAAFDSEGPLAEYGREQGNDIAGGVTYRGNAMPEFDGSYVFSDFWTGYLGSVALEGPSKGAINWFHHDVGISDIDIHPQSEEILLAAYHPGKILTLVRGPDPNKNPLPQRLSETGLFADLVTLTPAPGLVPYEINVSFWSDNAIKRRWFALPKSEQILKLHNRYYIDAPPGAVWVKQFDLELTPGDPSSLRRLETRVLVQDEKRTPYGFSYRWNEDQTDAVLVKPTGENQTFLINEKGTTREQTWRFPGQRECVSCHHVYNTGVLGFTPVQLNRDTDYGSGSVSQLSALRDAGYFDEAMEEIHTLPRLTPLEDETASLEHRVRSYLEANCAGCHRNPGSALSWWDARFKTALPFARILNEVPNRPYGIHEAAVVTPGSLEKSVLYQRISQHGPGRMPPIATSLLDPQGIKLIREWITTTLVTREFYEDWEQRFFGEEHLVGTLFFEDPDQDSYVNYSEFLAGTDPLNASDGFKLNISNDVDGVTIRFWTTAHRVYQVQTSASLNSTAAWETLSQPDNPQYPLAETGWRTVVDRRPKTQTQFYRILMQER